MPFSSKYLNKTFLYFLFDLDELILLKESIITLIFKVLALLTKDLKSSSPPNNDEIEPLLVIAIGDAFGFAISTGLPVSSS